MLEVRDLTLFYGKNKILNNLTFDIKQGEILCILGPNGSGKSTLLRCLAHILQPQSGQILIHNKNIKSYKKKDLAKLIGFMPQIQEVTKEITLEDFVAYGRNPYHGIGFHLNETDRNKIDWAMTYMGLTNLKHQRMGTLSGGERQRAYLALILVQDTNIILLDEPSNNLDIKYQWELLERMLELNQNFHKTIVAVFHDIGQVASIADQLLLLKQGRIYKHGPFKEVITEQTLEEVFDIKGNIVSLGESYYIQPIK